MMGGFPGGCSVLMALYQGDQPSLFEKALLSVFENSLQPNQFVLVIDGSISGELENVLIKFHQIFPGRIEELRLKTNQGLAKALNAGLEIINQTWVIRADADDVNLPERFAVLAKLIQERPKLQLFGSAIMEVDEFGNFLARRTVPCERDAIYQYARFRNPFNHMSVAYKKMDIVDLGGYPDLYLKEDYVLWIKALAKQWEVANTDQVLVHATTGRSMYERRGGWRLAKTEIKLQQHLVRHGLKTSARAFIDGLTRASFCLVPASLRRLVYLYLLR